MTPPYEAPGLNFVKKQRPRLRHANGDELYYFPGLKESFKLTERLNTRCSGVESLLSGQK